MDFFKKECLDKTGTCINGLYEIQPVCHKDVRGYFLETYNKHDFEQAGLNVSFVQDNQSFSTKDVLRGLHFQMRHPQGKLIHCLEGKIYDVALDLRKPSPTFGKWYGTMLSSANHNMLYIPEGFAHGFAVVSETALIAYKCTDYYHPEDENGILWNDASLGIDWSFALENNQPILSEKDKSYPCFMPQNCYFDLNGTWIGK